MERVVLGYDASQASEAALEWIAHRARGRRTELDIVLVTNMFLSDRIEADSVLNAAARRWRDLAPESPANVVRLDGAMPATLSNAARGADLLVLGVHPGFRTRTMLTGWVPLRAAARSGVPTGLIPVGWSVSDAPVTVGLDDDDSSAAAVLFAAQTASSSGVPLRVVHSWLMANAEPRWSDEHPRRPRDVADAHERILRAAVERVGEAQPDVVASAELVRDNPTSALTRAAERSSLLVIGTHGRSVVAGAFLGSVGMDLIGTLHCPICVVPSTSATA
ncbi:universal stress protein [Microbacterium sp. ACRRU]|jgi:nucleotide-binding universal stress UspA family protein|uniref:universal stress protein n=1 Tax=Microbacterium sp. ACRRU TaxID=2918204 RepID=UPI001EF6983B|nr:universal stress protein [Microbacterium sp. ACRRU]MCG7416971.1 universal stress protein [Microbacterium sp. ACRRU]